MTREVYGKAHSQMGKQKVRERKREEMGQKLDLMEIFLGMRNLKRRLCHDSESSPKLSPAFKGLLDNLRDYNVTQSINRTGQVTILCK